MKAFFFFAIASFCIIHSAASQPPAIEWQKSLGGLSLDAATSIQQTSDDGYIVAGFIYSSDGDISGNHGNEDYWVVKLNSSGQIQWQKSLGGTVSDIANSIQQTSDGGYIVAGYSRSNNGDVSGNHGSEDYWVAKLNSSGDLQWQKCLGGTGDDIANSIQQTTDGGYIVAGESRSNDGDVSGNHGLSLDGLSDYWIVKLSSSGDLQWQKCLGGTGDDAANSIQQTSDGGYIVTGASVSNNGDVSGNHGNKDFWIAKLNSNGDIQWQKCLGGTGDDYAFSIQQTSDGGYVVAGAISSSDGDVSGNHGNYDYWVVKLNSTGSTIEWKKALGGTSSDWAYNIRQTTDGGYIIAGSSESNDGDVSGNHGSNDYWVVKLNSGGDLQWQKCLGGSKYYDVANSIQQTSDGGYIVAGGSESTDGDVSGNHGDVDYWIVKLGTHPQPLSLLSFNAVKQGAGNQLSWRTTNEINTKAFRIERSNNGQGFAEIAMVAAAGNSTTNINYHFTDANPLPGKNFYRLKTEDKDGKTTYSMIRLIDRNYSISAIINPNPVNGNFINLTTSSGKNIKASFTISAADGKNWTAKSIQIVAGSNNNKLNISNLPPGTYFIALITGEEKQVLRFIKQ